MRLAIVLAALLLSACTVAPRAAALSPTPEPSTKIEANTSAAPSGEPSPEARVDEPVVTLAPAFPVVTSLALRAVPIDDEAQAVVRRGIVEYLESLDRFRESGTADRSHLGVSGRFGDVVAAGIAGSATPGVKRRFELGWLRVDRLLVKPWGTRALAEATVTIHDKAVEGIAPDQSETGRLRLIGDRLRVVDGWDAVSGRWFNGPTPLSTDGVRTPVAQAIAFNLRMESWVPGSALETSYGAGGDTSYLKARNEYLKSLDRVATPSRTFADINATIERYETFGEINDGLATVRVTATVLTTDAGGLGLRQPFERRVVILFGNWGPEVVDEEIAPGRWRSGGDLALGMRDRNFA